MMSAVAASPLADLGAAGQAASSPSRRAPFTIAVTLLLLSVTVFERFGVNFGSYSLNLAIPVMYGVLLFAAFTGAIAVSIPRLVIYLLCMATAVTSMFLNPDRSSSTSLMLLATIYLPFAFVVTPRSSVTPEAVLRIFLEIGFACALVGIAQFYLQFVFYRDWLFDYTGYIPTVLRGPSGFNTVIRVGAHYKSNGFFFREPSGFSFIMALALVAEHLTARRWLRLACFALALLISYSGTGLLALAIGMMVPLNRRTLTRAVLLGLAALLLYFLLDGVLNLSFTLGRVNEFGSERSSAYIRYVAPARLLHDTLTSDLWSPWFGHGPGTITRAAMTYEFHDPTWAKLLYEYGVLGFISFQVLLLAICRRSPAALSVRAILFAAWLVMGGHLLSPEQDYLTLALAGLFPVASAEGREELSPAPR